MTTGQRIAAKRRELDLSQEALGEALGVSRQSIYKWESDSSLPDVDKLVALSRLFHVSVGWLLGVEEDQEEHISNDLSPAQLKLVEEILSRYQQSSQLTAEQQERVSELVEQKVRESRSPRHRRLRYGAACLALLLVLLAGRSLFARLKELDRQYTDLANSVGNITYSVNSQIGSITSRVEEILKSQNSLVADYATNIQSADLASNTVTFSVRVVPKTYTEGLEILLHADTGDGLVDVPAVPGPGQEFSGQITCPLTDSITLSAVLVDQGTRQTQLLGNYSSLYGSSLPVVDISLLESALLNIPRGEDGLFHVRENYGFLTGLSASASAVNEDIGQSQVKQVQLGLFRNRALLFWLEPCGRPDNHHGFEKAEQWFHLPSVELDLQEGDELVFAALVTDQYGRQIVTPSLPASRVEGDEITWFSTSFDFPSEPDGWGLAG